MNDPPDFLEVPDEQRREKRFPIRLPVRFKKGSERVEAYTTQVSEHGFGVRASDSMRGLEGTGTLSLPNGGEVSGTVIWRSSVGDIQGFSFEAAPQSESAWRAFIAEEDATGSMWRMVSRFARSRGNEKESVRQVLEQGRLGVLFKRVGSTHSDEEVNLRFHTPGENGEAYRILFERCASSKPEDSAHQDTPGFLALSAALSRVLDEEVQVQFAPGEGVQGICVCELSRGGYAYVHVPKEGEGKRVGLVGLYSGELILVAIGQTPVFPNFSEEELERIACDSLRQERVRTASGAFRRPANEIRALSYAHHDAARDQTTSFRSGLDHVVRAQEASETRQKRYYGDRMIELFPEVWAKASASGEVMGPTMRDGERLLLLALVGPGTPRVVKLEQSAMVSLLGVSTKG